MNSLSLHVRCPVRADTDRGNLTCGGRQAALGYEAVDAETYAAWGIDYLKEDSCNNPAGGTDQQNAFEEYGRMRDALNATGLWRFVCVPDRDVDNRQRPRSESSMSGTIICVNLSA